MLPAINFDHEIYLRNFTGKWYFSGLSGPISGGNGKTLKDGSTTTSPSMPPCVKYLLNKYTDMCEYADIYNGLLKQMNVWFCICIHFTKPHMAFYTHTNIDTHVYTYIIIYSVQLPHKVFLPLFSRLPGSKIWLTYWRVNNQLVTEPPFDSQSLWGHLCSTMAPWQILYYANENALTRKGNVLIHCKPFLSQ